MAKIIINGVTHKATCLAGTTETDTSAYDNRIGDYMAWLGDKVRAAGHDFEVDDNGNGGASYRVSTDDEQQAQDAHDLMQSLPDFWAWY